MFKLPVYNLLLAERGWLNQIEFAEFSDQVADGGVEDPSAGLLTCA